MFITDKLLSGGVVNHHLKIRTLVVPFWWNSFLMVNAMLFATVVLEKSKWISIKWCVYLYNPRLSLGQLS